ncbi:MAG: S-layer homology domain-containing protein [Clostridia bacterium]|nr:S-layer homology domain-containing protein [Clostridia bacterium]
MKYRKESTKRRTAYASLFFLLVLLTITAVCSLSLHASAPGTVVSPGLKVLAEEYSMAMAGLRGNAISFEADDFARAVNLSRISSVTVTRAPAVADGELRVGNTVITGGQTLNETSLSQLTYVASGENMTTSSFRFTVNDSPVEITCHLYLLDQVNYCPTLSLVPKTSLNVSTHRNITLYGTLPCYDPDGDETRIEIVSYPETGILILTDKATGEYTFTPGEDYSGKDSFTYVARDRYGNYSASATVSLTVTKPQTSVVYADLADSPLHNSALTMTEKEVMSGTSVGEKTYFYPDLAVSRGEFVVMAMKAMGMREVTEVETTVFADDGSLSAETKNYLAAAYDLGYIKGEKGADGTLCFYPDREITRAEAAVIVGNMIDAATPTVTPVFSDSSEIPAWAAPSVYSLNSMGILSAEGDEISPLDKLTRGETARMLCALIVHTENK